MSSIGRTRHDAGLKRTRGQGTSWVLQLAGLQPWIPNFDSLPLHPESKKANGKVSICGGGETRGKDKKDKKDGPLDRHLPSAAMNMIRSYDGLFSHAKNPKSAIGLR